MSKNIRLLILLVVVAAAAYFIISRQPWSTWKSEKKDFTIADTASITKMFFADKKGHNALLEKNEAGVWMVNNSYPADMQKVNLMKETMHDVQVRNPVTEKEFNTVVASMANGAIKAEFYKGDKLVEAVYVGSGTPDQTGTYMMIEGSSTPFVTHIPGFVGYLSPRFNAFPLKWKDKLAFDYPMESIREIKVEYPMDEKQSFILQNEATPAVKSLKTNQSVMADPNFIKYYLNCFTKLYYEGFDEEIPQAQADSIRKTQPYCVITLTTKNGDTKKLQVNLKPIDDRTMMKYDRVTGKEYTYDTEKYFAFLDEDKELLYIQDYNFGKLFRTLDDFVKSGKR